MSLINLKPAEGQSRIRDHGELFSHIAGLVAAGGPVISARQTRNIVRNLDPRMLPEFATQLSQISSYSPGIEYNQHFMTSWNFKIGMDGLSLYAGEDGSIQGAMHISNKYFSGRTTIAGVWTAYDTDRERRQQIGYPMMDALVKSAKMEGKRNLGLVFESGDMPYFIQYLSLHGIHSTWLNPTIQFSLKGIESTREMCDRASYDFIGIPLKYLSQV